MSEIRRINKNDILELRELFKTDIGDSKEYESTLRYLESENGLKYACIAEHNGEIIGFVNGLAMMNVFSPQYLYVKQSHRGKGIGKKLMKMLESISGHSNFLVFHHEKLQGYYEKLGYVYEDDLTIGCKGNDAMKLKSIVQPIFKAATGNL